MISVKELANILGVFRKTIYALCERGDIPCYRIGTGRGTLRFDLEEAKQALRPAKPILERQGRGAKPHLR